MKMDKTSCRTNIAGRFDAETNRSARISSALGYIFFFIPLVMHPESKFALYHANQGFLLLLWMTVGLMLASWIPYAGPLLLIAAAIFGLACTLRGIILALRCQAKRMPLIGRPVIISYENTYSLEV